MVGAYERIAMRLVAKMGKAPKKCGVINGRHVSGNASQHRTPEARMWRTFWRIKLVRV